MLALKSVKVQSFRVYVEAVELSNAMAWCELAPFENIVLSRSPPDPGLVVEPQTNAASPVVVAAFADDSRN